MTKKELHTLAIESFKGNKLDEEQVLDITKFMDRRTLKGYIRALKQLEKQHRVSIALPNIKGYNGYKEIFEKLFTGKQIIVEENPSLIIGLRVTDNDMIYEQSLQNSLDTLVSNIKSEYE